MSGPRGTVINYWEGGLQNAGGKSIFASAKRGGGVLAMLKGVGAQTVLR